MIFQVTREQRLDGETFGAQVAIILVQVHHFGLLLKQKTKMKLVISQYYKGGASPGQVMYISAAVDTNTIYEGQCSKVSARQAISLVYSC